MAMLRAKWQQGKFVCVGLDSDISKMPDWVTERAALWTIEEQLIYFNIEIVKATFDLVCAYKPNIAFYEHYGDAGFKALQQTIVHIQELAPDVPIILDAKRADISNTNNSYVAATFDWFGADGITVNPYLGGEALQPFLDQKHKGIFVLCRTSNPGAGEFQDFDIGGYPLYQIVARHVANKWNDNGNCGLVVGATMPDELRQVRQRVDDLPILIPGIGAQGGGVEATVRAGRDSRGQGMIINSSRGIIFADDPRQETIKLSDQITAALAQN